MNTNSSRRTQWDELIKLHSAWSFEFCNIPLQNCFSAVRQRAEVRAIGLTPSRSRYKKLEDKYIFFRVLPQIFKAKHLYDF